MIKILTTACFCFSTLFCFSQTQNQMNEDAGNQYKKADKELNSTYNKILKEYSGDPIFINNFKIAQRLWIQFRDAEVNSKYPHKEQGYYGSVLPTCWALEMEELTKERTKKLKIWLTGIEEGDVCTGSVKYKN